MTTINIFNKLTQTGKLNITERFTKADYFYFNFEGINPPKGIKFGVALIIDFKGKETENKELPLITQFADSNFLLPLIRPINLDPKEATAYLKFRTDEEIQVSVDVLSLSPGVEQMNQVVQEISLKIAEISNKIDDLNSGGSGNNSSESAPVDRPNEQNRSKSL